MRGEPKSTRTDARKRRVTPSSDALTPAPALGLPTVRSNDDRRAPRSTRRTRSDRDCCGDGREDKLVTYAGHPLYRFVGDTRAGQTSGEGSNEFRAGWDALFPSGKKIEKDAD